MKRFHLLACFLAVIASFTPRARAAAVDYYVQIPGITCPDVRAGYGFPVNGFTIGITDPSAVVNPGSGSGVGKAELSAFTITKVFDTCSEPLIKSALRGLHLQTLTLSGLHATSNSANVPVVTIILYDAIPTSYQLAGRRSAPEESISFTYRKLCISSSAMLPDGSVGPAVTVCYDKATNVTS